MLCNEQRSDSVLASHWDQETRPGIGAPRLNILVISQQWEPEEGTPQRRWAHFVAGLVGSGHRVAVIAAPPHYPGGALISDNPQHAPGAVARGKNGEIVFRSQFRPHERSLAERVLDQAVVATSSLILASKLIGKHRPDVILTTAPPIPSAVTAALVGKTHRVPYIVDLRDVWPDLLSYMNEWGSRAEANPQSPLRADAFDTLIAAGGWIFRWALKNAAGVITTTPSFANKLRKEGFSNVLNIRNMASVRESPVPPLEESQVETNRGDGTLRILYAGTTGRAQGLDSALEALRLAVEAGVDARMRIAGSGAHLRLLKLHAERDHLPVEFLDRIGYEEVDEHYDWCDTSLVHLRSWEPLSYTVPSKLYEALSFGRHVSVAANGESARIITETGAGHAVPSMNPQALANLWVELASNRELLDVGTGGRDWLLKRETPKQNSKKVERFALKVVRDNKHRGRRLDG